MKKLIFIIVAVLISVLSWIFIEKPQPPFGALVTANPVLIPALTTNDKDSLEFFYTDDNTGEDLIINSDKENYTGPGEITVYFSVQNISIKNQNVDLAFYANANLVDIQEVVFDVPYQRKVIDYSEIEKCGIGENEEGDSVAYCYYPEVGSHLETYYVDEWQKKEKNSNEVHRPDNSKTVKNLKEKGNITSLINSGNTKYYKAKLQYKPFSSREEFFIEAVGDQGGYGHLF